MSSWNGLIQQESQWNCFGPKLYTFLFNCVIVIVISTITGNPEWVFLISWCWKLFVLGACTPWSLSVDMVLTPLCTIRSSFILNEETLFKKRNYENSSGNSLPGHDNLRGCSHIIVAGKVGVGGILEKPQNWLTYYVNSPIFRNVLKIGPFRQSQSQIWKQQACIYQTS